MLQVIKFGFQEIKIKDDYAYHPQFWSKGRLLYESNCVHAVQELKYRENSKHEWSVSIKGIVERQTSKSLPPYDVTLNVSEIYNHIYSLTICILNEMIIIIIIL